MQFFIPGAATAEEAEMVLASTARFVARRKPQPPERIFRLTYEHNGERHVAEVGKPIDPYYKSHGPVIAIIGGNPLLICMRDRGVLCGGPILVATQSVEKAEYFDDDC
jgi:hypothetical protein